MNVSLQSVRPAAVAGTFYPADPAALRLMVQQQLSAVRVESCNAPGFITPHAGLIYSGPVAAHVYARIALLRGKARVIVLIGPPHYVSVRGVAAVSVGEFATPLGSVPVATALIAQLCVDSVHIDDEAHEAEHCLEVQLPFLQEVLGDFEIVPLLCGRGSEAAAGRALEMICRQTPAIVIASSDLSHYLPYDVARARDARTAHAIQMLNGDDIGPSDACGYAAVRTLLAFARTHGLHARTLDLRNSGDTAGPHNRVVGYGAFEFCTAKR